MGKPAPFRNTFGVLILLALAPGCGKLDRVGDCRALAKTVNRAFDAIEPLVKANSYAGYRDAAKQYSLLVDALRSLPHRAAGLKELATEYTAALAEVPPQLASYALAVRDADEARREANARALERISRRERALVTRISAYCAGRL